MRQNGQKPYLLVLLTLISLGRFYLDIVRPSRNNTRDTIKRCLYSGIFLFRMKWTYLKISTLAMTLNIERYDCDLVSLLDTYGTLSLKTRWHPSSQLHSEKISGSNMRSFVIFLLCLHLTRQCFIRFHLSLKCSSPPSVQNQVKQLPRTSLSNVHFV